LLEHETLDEADAYRAAGFTREAPSTNGRSPEHVTQDSERA
jgi:hypothetical protein